MNELVVVELSYLMKMKKKTLGIDFLSICSSDPWKKLIVDSEEILNTIFWIYSLFGITFYSGSI